MLFNDFKNLIDHINKSLGNFTDIFGTERKRLANLGKRPTRGMLFTYDPASNRNWAINEGGGTEVQYHIGIEMNEMSLIYGLGFNTQYVPFANEKSMVEYMKPYMNAFLSKEQSIRQILPDYYFVYGNTKELTNPQPNKYILFGKEEDINDSNGKIEIDDVVLNTLFDDLKRQFEAYKIIFETKNKNPHMDAQRISIANLLRYKKQIILQGPPGTGKTKLAKEIASEMIGIQILQGGNSNLTNEEIVESLRNVTKIRTVAGGAEYQLLKVDRERENVTLKKSTETEATTDFEKIRQFYKGDYWKSPVASNDDRRAAAIAKHIATTRKPLVALEDSKQFKIIQFHPSYSYEDFVRGIVSKPNEDGDGIMYEPQNKILAAFAKEAAENYRLSQSFHEASKKTVQTKGDFERFIDYVQDHIADSKDHKYPLTDDVYLFESDETRFKYKGDNWVAHSRGLNMKYSELENLIQAGVTERAQIKHLEGIEVLTKQHATYFFNTLKKFREFLQTHSLEVEEPQIEEKTSLKSYLLIIDEINRANLSSVLGELIYALEYRGENVESMYEVDGSNKLLLPPNLYIIGTMNTADRSVGHIDYAIRRRFAFVPIPPKDLSTELGDIFKKQLFDKVQALFSHDTHLSYEFTPADVQLGHSYFIDKSDEGGSIDIRLQYEIIPILEEYIKDGVLKESEDLRKAIKGLENAIV